ncbi:MAG: TonB family protein [Deltaproteobacteria bacterium]|nr:TonB family protein [Deltaproteobacteria bacterium]
MSIRSRSSVTTNASSHAPHGLGTALVWVGGSVAVHVALLSLGVTAYRTWNHDAVVARHRARAQRAPVEHVLPVELAAVSRQRGSDSFSSAAARPAMPTLHDQDALPREPRCDPRCLQRPSGRPMAHHASGRAVHPRHRPVRRTAGVNPVGSVHGRRKHAAADSQQKASPLDRRAVVHLRDPSKISDRVALSARASKGAIDGHGARSRTGAARPHGSDRREPDGAAVAARIHALVQRRIVYPLRARRMGIEGRVVLLFRIRSGRAQSIRIVASAGGILNRAAIEAVHRSEPLPRYQGTVRVPVQFKLDR